MYARLIGAGTIRITGPEPDGSPYAFSVSPGSRRTMRETVSCGPKPRASSIPRCRWRASSIRS
jgi:hypothetical protein